MRLALVRSRSAARLGERHAGQGRRGRRADVGPWVQPEQPEHPRGGLRQVPVRQREHSANIGGRVADVQRVEAAPELGEFGDQRSQRQVRRCGGTGDDHGKRERQPGAERGQPGDGVRLRVRPVRPEPRGEQFDRLSFRQHVQAEQPGAFGRRESGQLTAAGDDHETARRRGQQRAHLGDVRGVVEQHEHRPVGQQAAVQRREPLGGGREPFRVHLKRVEEPVQHVGGLGGTARGVEAAQVGVELPVREVRRDPVRPVERESGFSHPRRTADRGDHDACAAQAGVAEHGVEQPQFAGPAGEVRHGSGQLPGDGRLRRDLRRLRRGRRGRQGRQGRQGRLVTRHPVSRDQLRPCCVRQPERADERPHRTRVRPAGPSPLHVRDGPHADPGPLGQVLLGQPGSDPPPAQPHPRWHADPCSVHDHPPARHQPVTASLTAGGLPEKYSLSSSANDA